jgi:GT2 family glycosyltransferase
MRSDYSVEVVVVDNHSLDSTVSMIEQLYPSVTVIKQLTNVGFGQANNVGIKVALQLNADFVFLLNQDAWVDSGTIEKLMSACESDNRYGIVSPMHYMGSGIELDTGFKSCISKDYTESEIEDFEINPTAQILDSQFINAAAWLISYECLQKVGGFGSIYFQYGEDRDYINRLNFAGLKLGFITNCKVFHDRENRPKDSNFATKEKLEWYYSVACLVWLSDINKFFPFAILKSLYDLSANFLFHFIKGRFYSVPAFFGVLSATLRSFRKILIYRKQLKNNTGLLFIGEPQS